MTLPVLNIKGLRVAIRTDDGVARVLDDIDLTLERGRILGVVGESGCGKSTLIRSIMGILPKGAAVDGGEIWFEGENLLVFSEAELNAQVRSSRIGFIPQDPLLALNPVFKVGTQLLEVMRDHAPQDGSRGGDRCVIYAGQTVEAGPVQSVLQAPAHPYTKALLACHPDRATSFVGIPGMVPSPLAHPPGCLFAARCGDVQARCCDARPAQGRAASGAEVRCVQYA